MRPWCCVSDGGPECGGCCPQTSHCHQSQGLAGQGTCHGVTGHTHKCYNFVNFANTQGRFHNTELEIPDGNRQQCFTVLLPSVFWFGLWVIESNSSLQKNLCRQSPAHDGTLSIVHVSLVSRYGVQHLPEKNIG